MPDTQAEEKGLCTKQDRLVYKIRVIYARFIFKRGGMIMGKIKEYIARKRRTKLLDKAKPFIKEVESKYELQINKLKQELLNGCVLYDEPKRVFIESDDIKKDPELLIALSVVSERFRLLKGNIIPKEDLLDILFATYEAAEDELRAAYSGSTLPPAHWRKQRKAKLRINLDSCNFKKGSPDYYESVEIVLFCK